MAERECTIKCKSKQHAEQAITSLICNVTDEQVAAFLHSLCANFHCLLDKFGRNVVLMASSCHQRSRLIEWLFNNFKVDVNLKDYESGWTALHRSLFYGQIATTCVLLQNGANISILDHDGYSPLDLVAKDLQNISKQNLCASPCSTVQEYSELYVFGSNANYNLGEESEQQRSVPTLVDYFTKNKINLVQVVMQKYHSVFLSIDGKVYTCGHGRDGRLGQGTEQTRMLPNEVKLIQQKNHPVKIQQVAAGDNHTVLLSYSGDVYTCGLNNCHQLGHNPAPDKLLRPLKVNLKNIQGIRSVHAATFHTVICTKSSVYTCGLNAGQLGHSKSERTQLTFRQISRLNKEGINITHVSVSNGATVCVTDNRFIYIFHEYKANKLPAFPNIVKIEVIGGHLDPSCDPGILSKVGQPLSIALLNSEGNVYMFEKSNFQMTRCIFSYVRQPFITDFSLNTNSVVLVTAEREAFKGHVLLPSKDRQSKNKLSTDATVKSAVKQEVTFQTFVEKKDCFMVKLERLAHVYRAVKIYSNLQGKSFSVLQTVPAFRIEAEIKYNEHVENEEYIELLSETFVSDSLHDVIIDVNGKRFGAHKYILASRCSYFRRLFESDNSSDIKIPNWNPDLFEAFLQFIYGNVFNMPKITSNKAKDLCHCPVIDTAGLSAFQVAKLKSNKCKYCSTKETVICNPIEMSKLLGLKKLTRHLMSKNEVVNKAYSDILQFQQNDLDFLSDLKIISSDNIEFNCHKCILIARSTYFKGMFMSSWLESSSSGALNLPITSDVIQVVLDYFYENQLKLPSDSPDLDLTCNVLVAADHFLMDLLKYLCEYRLTELVSLKNCAELLQFAHVYGGDVLSKYCTQFICQNLAAVLELRVLDALDKEILDFISKSYLGMLTTASNRFITPYSTYPRSDDIKRIAEKSPISFETTLQPIRNSNDTDTPRNSKAQPASRPRRRSQRQNSVCNDDLDTSFGASSDITPGSPETKIEEQPIQVHVDTKKEVEIKDDEVMDSFPQLGEKSPSSQANRREKNFGGKLSQKQRKKMAAEKNKESSAVIVPQQKISNPWQVAENTDNNSTSVSMKDIINNEKISNDNVCEKLSSLKIKSPKEQKCYFKWNLKEQFTEAEDFASVWKQESLAEKTPVSKENRFSDIIEIEEKASAQLIRNQAKTLSVIQLEDKAIEELKVYYKCEDATEEFIVIQRHNSSTAATPIWKR